MIELTIQLAEHIHERLSERSVEREVTIDSLAAVYVQGGLEVMEPTSLLIVLAPKIYDRLSKGADDLGLELDTFCMAILGKAAYSDWVQAPKPMPSVSEMLGPNWMDTIQEIMGFLSAAGGSMACPHCTQRVDVDSFKSGVCSHCETPLRPPIPEPISPDDLDRLYSEDSDA